MGPWAKNAFRDLGVRVEQMTADEVAAAIGCSRGHVCNMAVRMDTYPRDVHKDDRNRGVRRTRQGLGPKRSRNNGRHCQTCGKKLAGANYYWCDDICRDEYAHVGDDGETDRGRIDGEYLYL